MRAKRFAKGFCCRAFSKVVRLPAPSLIFSTLAPCTRRVLTRCAPRGDSVSLRRARQRGEKASRRVRDGASVSMGLETPEPFCTLISSFRVLASFSAAAREGQKRAEAKEFKPADAKRDRRAARQAAGANVSRQTGAEQHPPRFRRPRRASPRRLRCHATRSKRGTIPASRAAQLRRHRKLAGRPLSQDARCWRGAYTSRIAEVYRRRAGPDRVEANNLPALRRPVGQHKRSQDFTTRGPSVAPQTRACSQPRPLAYLDDRYNDRSRPERRAALARRPPVQYLALFGRSQVRCLKHSSGAANSTRARRRRRSLRSGTESRSDQHYEALANQPPSSLVLRQLLTLWRTGQRKGRSRRRIRQDGG